MTGLASVRGAAPRPPPVMPLPAEWRYAPGRLMVTSAFSAAVRGADDARLDVAIAALERAWQERTGFACGAAPSGPGAATLVIECAALGSAIPVLGEDESYTLDVDSRRAVLRAPLVVGALRGLATLTQLLEKDPRGWSVPAIAITDAPRFPWRGLLLDASRHWMPPDVIRRELDGMALVKLNVLHWHLTDDQGFRVESRRYPRLQEFGSDGHYYTQEQIRALVAYAAARGIRVVPEFDVPGHTTSWLVGYPELAAAPGPYAIERRWGVFDPTMDPTNEALYRMLDGFLGEMAALFPDPWVHLGGDEVNGKQWNANPRIQEFIRAHVLKDDAGVQAWFNGRLLKLLARYHRKMIGWDEILNASLPTSVMIESWRGREALGAAAQRGYSGILANGYYIDLCHPAAEHYANDPVPADTLLTVAEQKRILGGEGTMWAEWVTPETIDSRIWPRMAAIAERLWSPRSVNDVDDLYRRLAIVNRRLEEAGLRQESYLGPMLRTFAGPGASAGDLRALRTVVEALEPVKGYHRAEQQPDATQLTPLDGVPDCARPDSASARDFALLTEAYLFGPGAGEPATAAALLDRLAGWSAAAQEVLDHLAPASPRVREVAPLLEGFAATCTLGGEAVTAIRSHTPCSEEWRQLKLAALAADGESRFAVEIPAVESVRLLICAAAVEDQRAGMSAAAWRELVEKSAAEAVTP